MTEQTIQPNLFRQSRLSARMVAQRALSVFVRRPGLEALAAQYTPHGLLGVPHDPRLYFAGSGEDVAAYLITLATVRFGSGYFQQLVKRGGVSRAQMLPACLAEHFRTHGPLAAAELRILTPAQVAALLGQQDPEASTDLMDLYARALRELGELLSARFGGSAARLIEAAGGSAERLVLILESMPYFRDVQRYRGLEIPFHLRAQRAAIELAQAFGGEGLGRFDDLAELAPSSDPAVAHVLHLDHVLAYDRTLEERIERGDPVPAHSEREVEIRACALHAVDLLVLLLRRRGVSASPLAVDTWLRLRGQGGAYRARLRHRVRTVHY